MTYQIYEHLNIFKSKLPHCFTSLNPLPTHTFSPASASSACLFSPLLPRCTVLRFASLLSHNLGYFRILLHLYFASFGPERGQNIVHSHFSVVSWFLSTPRCLLWSVSVDESVKRTKCKSHTGPFTPLKGESSGMHCVY